MVGDHMGTLSAVVLRGVHVCRGARIWMDKLTSGRSGGPKAPARKFFSSPGPKRVGKGGCKEQVIKDEGWGIEDERCHSRDKRSSRT